MNEMEVFIKSKRGTRLTLTRPGPGVTTQSKKEHIPTPIEKKDPILELIRSVKSQLSTTEQKSEQKPLKKRPPAQIPEDFVMPADPVYRVERTEAAESYYMNDRLHRADGPAVIKKNGDQLFYQLGYLHRIDGPAIIKANGWIGYYNYGKKINIKKK